ncbi:iron-sulfur cluster repair di-iron protein [Alkalibacter rhizosphaerae]|uniref:Iron-sulfur cluster repair di-iron protein n=1 Tax=Alkalibacter rhizosphaerae TaxID=2815577 RepID=A0A975AI59_9FIRM|nr:iron-sulfur cluster repair di-iron protein [Alkalibacter rhizosphaerae]QSX09334.1 iron-sulfur cluster repair di-iron protein [Alkalibacter rhizosphaerae]
MKNTIEFTKKHTLGSIVASFPKAAEVLQAYRIDFCCGGHRSLEEAAAEKNVEAEKVLASIHALAQETTLEEGTVYTDLTDAQLIDHIVNTHHAYLNQNLPVISHLANAVLRAHGDAHPELFEVFKDFHGLKADLEQHLIKEEVTLFPAILKGQDHGSVRQEVESEHEVAGELLRNLRDLTQDFTVPADGCPSYERFYGLLEELEGDIFQHVHKENNILFQRQ